MQTRVEARPTKGHLAQGGVLGQFLNSGQMRIGDRLLIAPACAEGIRMTSKKDSMVYGTPA
jgi:hypothetical protein